MHLLEALPESVFGKAMSFRGSGRLSGAPLCQDRQLLFAGSAPTHFGRTPPSAPGSVIATMGLHPAIQNASQLLIGNSWTAVELVEPWRCTQTSLPGRGSP